MDTLREQQLGSARFLGMAYGMFLAARDLTKHVAWINAMTATQAFDWLGTLHAIGTGAISFAQAANAPFLPLIFIAVLLVWYPRNSQVAIGKAASR